MCGIVGLAGDLRHGDNKVFRNLLIFDQLRGDHSTGVFALPLATEGKTLKQVGPPNNLWDFDESDSFNNAGVLKGAFKTLIGHNRFATMGELTVENAHPFSYSHITGVHNGTLKNWRTLEGGKDLDIDSKTVFNHIAEKGIKDLWSKMHGAASLVWWDDEEKTLNFIRNSERPMHIAKIKDRKAIVWASEPWMINVACSRSGVELEESGPVSTDVHKHYKFKPEGTSCNLVSIEKLDHFVPVYTPRENWFGFPTRYSLFNVSKADKHNPLLSTFSYKTEKADKKLVNLEFIFDTARVVPNGGYYLRGFLLSDPDQRVEIIPQNRHEYDSLLGAINEEIFKNVSRWRVKKDGTYVISSSHIRMVDYLLDKKEEGGDVIDEEDNVVSFHQSASDTEKKQVTCVSCSNLIPEDEVALTFFSGINNHVCINCQEDESVKEYLYGFA